LQTEARFDGPGGGDAVLSGWNGFGEQASSTTAMGGASRTLSYGYDADGARTSVTWPDANYLVYHRYDTGQLYYTGNNLRPFFHTPLDAAGRLTVLYRWHVGAATWEAFPTTQTET
jgi:YD repeat-containing protein